MEYEVTMGRRAPKRNFQSSAESSFRFLVDEFGYGEPAYSEVVIPTLTYDGPVLRYLVGFDDRDGAASVIVRKTGPDGQSGYRSSLRDIVERSGQGSLPDRKVRKPEELERRLKELASWIRVLHVVLLTPDGDELILTPDWPTRN